MPNIKSAKKRVLTNKRDELRNRAAKSTLKTTLKKVSDISELPAEEQTKVLRTTQALIARTAKRGIIHKNKAARLQSRLMKKVSSSTEA